MDQLQQYLQNILTEHLENMHGSLCIIKLHGNKITADRLGEITVPEIRNITEPSLHACASHHRNNKKYMGYTTGKMAWHTIKHM